MSARGCCCFMLFSRKKNSSSYDVRFSRFRYFKAVRADTYGLAKVVRCGFWTQERRCCVTVMS
jgi:hypothetical protein